ncbi:MAG: hypothetical protein JWM21_887 [Acidobacteria bacterium]|nr:hypothetical protein [Acidobacteriota bacterium]
MRPNTSILVTSEALLAVVHSGIKAPLAANLQLETEAVQGIEEFVLERSEALTSQQVFQTSHSSHSSHHSHSSHCSGR